MLVAATSDCYYYYGATIMWLISTQSGDPLFLTESDTTAEMSSMEGRSVIPMDWVEPEHLSGLDLPIIK